MNSKIKCVLGILLVATIILGMAYLFGDNHSNNTSKINNAADFEVPSDFVKGYNFKDGSFVKYKSHGGFGNHEITIQNIDTDERYRLCFVPDDDCEIIETNVPNIYKRWIGSYSGSQTDFTEMIKVNNKTFAVSIYNTDEMGVSYDPDSLQKDLAEFNKLNNIKPVKLNEID